MGDIPDVSAYLETYKSPRHSSSSKHPQAKHTPQTIKFALELEHKRKKNEELNAMISSAASDLTAKTKDQIKKMGKLAARVRDCKDELTALKQHLLLPRSLHQVRIVQFSLELSMCDVANPKILSSHVRQSFPKLFNMPRLYSSLIMIKREVGSISYVKDDSDEPENDITQGARVSMVDEVIATKHLVRHVIAGKTCPIDVTSLPIFSPSEEVIAVLECLVELSDLGEEGVKAFSIEDELTLFCCASALSLAVGMNQKADLNARLVVNDQVRRLYTEQMRATEVSQR